MPGGYIFCPSADRLEVEEPELRPRQAVFTHCDLHGPLHSDLTLPTLLGEALSHHLSAKVHHRT